MPKVNNLPNIYTLYLFDNKLKEQLAEENVLVLYWTKRYKAVGPIKNHKKLQVIKSTHGS
jgi:hypothetical protein